MTNNQCLTSVQLNFQHYALKSRTRAKKSSRNEQNIARFPNQLC